MKILVANLGSTSLKYRLFECSGDEEKLLTQGGYERVSNYAETIDQAVQCLKDGGWINSERDLAAVGFKPILAKGITGCVRMDESVLEAMESYREIAPAHNPPYINGVRQFSKCMPDTPLIGLFETAFYQWAPEAAMRYGVPESWFDLGIRRWGYHGASHKFIAERSAELLKRDDVATRVRNLYVDQGTSPVENPELRVVSCHLGGSSSITGIRSGLAIGNSLGLSPQSGLPHNNRVGELDSIALPYIMKTTGISLEEAESQMCNEAGLKGLSGGYNDIRDIKQQAADGNTKARLALDVLIHQARHWIGSYTFQLNGLDALVFTAGISENNPDLRQEICNNLDQLGIQLDPEKNKATIGVESVISKANSPVQVMVIPTNEELVIAREVKRYLTNN